MSQDEPVLPPNDSDAERAALGSVLLDWKNAMPTCIEWIGSKHDIFYELRHQQIYGVMVEMYDANEAIDLVTLSAWLSFQSLLDSVGGVFYLDTLIEATPSAANLTYYLNILTDMHKARRLIRICSEKVADAYDKTQSTDDLIFAAATQMMALADDSIAKNGEASMQELMPAALQQIESWHASQGVMSGIATGFPDLDKMTTGLHGNEMIVIAGRPSMGKAQPITRNVLTPYGFMPIGNIQVGFEVIGWDGLPKRVIGVFPQGIIDVYEVEMSDGCVTKCSRDHLWFTQTRTERRRRSPGSVKTLAQIQQTLLRSDGGKRNHVIPICRPVQFSAFADLPLDPWLLGALIGDGNLKRGNIMFSKPEVDLHDKIQSRLPDSDTVVSNGMDVRIKRKQRNNGKSTTKTILEDLGLNVYSEDKFIPDHYLHSPPEARLELLRGLLDTDGHVCGHGIEFSTASVRLAEGVEFLVRSLGGICSRGQLRFPSFVYKGEKKTGQLSYRMWIWFVDQTVPVSSAKHLSRFQIGGRYCHRSIVKVTPSVPEECVCIAVDDPNGLYLTDDFIVTHNTSLAMNIADHAAVELGLPVGVFSLEMTKEALAVRLLCSRARVNARNIQAGFLSHADMPKITTATNRLVSSNLFINDESGLNILGLRTRARRMAQKHGIKLLVIDYLQLMTAERRSSDSREQEVSFISKGVKALAKELDIPIIALSQLNRGLEKEKDRRPRMSDLRESGSLEQDADFVGILWKPYTEEREDDAVAVNLEVCKQRNGPTGTVPLTFLRHYTRFESAANVSNNGSAGYQAPYSDNEPQEQQQEFPS